MQYTGAIDNDTENTNPGKTKYVDQVIIALLQNQPPPFTVTKAIGCGVKRKAWSTPAGIKKNSIYLKMLFFFK